MDEENLETTAIEQVPEAEPTEESQPSGSDPLTVIFLFGAAAYLFWLWLSDFKEKRTGKGAIPGATPAGGLIIGIAVVGALVILALETAGEYALGVSAEQSDILLIFLLAMIGAGFMEEIVFRGYLVVTSKGKAALIASILGFSLLFTLIHPFFWDYNLPEDAAAWQFWNASFSVDFGQKAFFSSAIVFLNSLWFYFMRFNPLNKERSLIPCFCAHIASNLGVFAVKLAQGHVVGLW